MAKNTLTIGSAPDNDIKIENSYVSGHHAQLVKNLQGIFIEDLKSTNHTYVSGVQISFSQIRPGEDVYISAKCKLDWRNPILQNWIDTPIDSPSDIHQQSGQSLTRNRFNINELDKDIITIGRAATSDIVLSHPRISREHAVLRKEATGSWVIEDKASANGTFVDGIRIKTSPITAESVISLSGLPVQLIPSDIPLDIEVPVFGEAIIELEELTFTVPDGHSKKIILNDITITISPGEFVGLIGPSGSGKTTLMLLLNGYNNPSKGSVYINGVNLHKEKESFKGFSGYVPQDDIIHRELTVEKSLLYNARLRLPDHSVEERMTRVHQVINDLGLSGTENVIVGTPEKKGISGGQRKRVNLGQELLTEPSILLLDEPCSGLDPQSDNDVMMLLKNLTQKGKSVILTTHNITERNFRIIDKLIVLGKGGILTYYGPSEKAARYFEVDYPENIFEALESRSADEWHNRYLNSEYHKYSKPLRSKHDPSALIQPKPPRTNIWLQMYVLSKRYTEIIYRDKWRMALLFGQPVIIGLLLSLVHGCSTIHDVSLTNPYPYLFPLFILVIAGIWLGVSNSCKEIVKERAIFRRENKVFLKILPYIGSKLLILTGIAAAQCLILLLFASFGCHLESTFHLLPLILVVSIVASALGLMISSFSSTIDQALALSPVVLIPQVIAGGVLWKLSNYDDIKWLFQGIFGMTISRWGYSAGMIIEDSLRKSIGQTPMQSHGISGDTLGLDYLLLIMWFLIYLFLAWYGIRKKT